MGRAGDPAVGPGHLPDRFAETGSPILLEIIIYKITKRRKG